MNGSAMENLTFECKARSPRKQPAASLSIASKNPLHRNANGSRLLFRPYFVIAQFPHEYFLVYGLPGVVEHR